VKIIFASAIKIELIHMNQIFKAIKLKKTIFPIHPQNNFLNNSKSCQLQPVAKPVETQPTINQAKIYWKRHF
jgi:hypothetical protein